MSRTSNHALQLFFNYLRFHKYEAKLPESITTELSPSYIAICAEKNKMSIKTLIVLIKYNKFKYYQSQSLLIQVI